MSTLDAHLVAIDARTGNLVWDRETADHQSGYSKTAAPLVVGDQVVTGIAGGEYGIRGFIDSYDAASGEQVWRAWTIPGPDHPDNQTWAGDSWRTGGSASWITGAYDPSSTSSTGAPATPARTGTATCGSATTSTRTRPWPSTAPPASSSGTSSSRRTTCTTGTPSRCRFSPT